MFHDNVNECVLSVFGCFLFWICPDVPDHPVIK